MSVVIIGGSGGGHAAVKYLSDNYHRMDPDEKSAAVLILRQFVAAVNQEFGTGFDEHNL